MMPGAPWRGMIGTLNGQDFTFQPDVVIEESGNDDLVITEHPVEASQAAVTDHAYKKPARVAVSMGFSRSSHPQDSPPTYLQDTYQFLLDVQNSRELFTLCTGKRIYPNMLIAGLRCTTNKRTENILAIEMLCQQVIIVQTVTTTVKTDPAVQAAPQDTMPVVNTGQLQLSRTAIFNGAAAGIPGP